MSTDLQPISLMPRPDFTKMFGLTHDFTGAPVVRTPRTLKVQIGQPAGRDIHVWINKAGQWVVMVWKRENGKRVEDNSKILRGTRAQAERHYREIKASAPDRNHPVKLPYFTFSRLAADGTLEPDFDAIERHGPIPTEIDIVFTDDQPFTAAYEMWAKSGIRCRGDGVNAERILEMAKGEDEKRLAETAKAAGGRFFPIINGCWTMGCPYSKPEGDKPSLCKPHGRLSFQLLNDIRLGGKAVYDSTGYRTISNLFSNIREILTFTGRGNPENGYVRAIPLKMLVRQFKTNHNGQPGTAYEVKLEFRAESIVQLRDKILEFRKSMELPTPRPMAQIAAPSTEEPEPETVEAEATAIVDEFNYPDDGPIEEVADGDDEGDPAGQPATVSETMQAATETATEDLKGRLAATVVTPAAQPAPAPATEPQAASAPRARRGKAGDAGDFGTPATPAQPATPQTTTAEPTAEGKPGQESFF